MCDLYTYLGIPEPHHTELHFLASASAVTWWIRGAALAARWRQQQDGPVTLLAAYAYDSERDWPYDDVADEDLECCATFELLELAPGSCRVVARWLGGPEHEYWPVYDNLLAELRETFGGAAAESGRTTERPVGPQGGTMERVKEARELVEGGMSKTEACRRARTDTRTYDRYVAELVDWDAHD